MSNRSPTSPRAKTLGGFIAELMERQHHSNRSLAAASGISEGAVRNLLRFGQAPNTKEPDARTLRQVAEALGVNPLLFYRLAGYLPPAPDARSVRAEFVADAFDTLATDKQEAILALLDVMVSDSSVARTVREIRSDPSNALAGIDLSLPNLARLMANHLIAQYQMTEVADIASIAPDAQVLQYKWSDLPQATQQRVKALIRHKLSLDYDATMVDPEWRE